eukprot:2876623-Pyramimonas_sp.AAC.1
MWCLVWDTGHREWKVSEFLTQPFGALGGAFAWWRCAQAIKAVAARAFKFILFVCVDDAFMVDLQPHAQRAMLAFQELGWDLDPGKSEGTLRSNLLKISRVVF